jgi:hypothetical protein
MRPQSIPYFKHVEPWASRRLSTAVRSTQQTVQPAVPPVRPGSEGRPEMTFLDPEKLKLNSASCAGLERAPSLDETPALEPTSSQSSWRALTAQSLAKS